MAYIILPSRRTRQPQGAVRVNAASTFANRLAFCAPLNPGGGLVDIVSGQFGSRTGLASITAQANGAYPLFGTSSYLDFSNIFPGTGVSNPLTLAWTQTPVGATAYGAVLCFKPTGATNGFTVFQSVSDAGYYFTVGRRESAIPVAQFSAVGPTTNGALDRFVVILPEGVNGSYANYVLWKNGARLTPSGSTGFGANTSSTFRIGALDTGSDPFEGAIGNVHIWTRALSDVEDYEWSLPGGEFSAYAPDVRRIYFGASGGAGETGIVLSDAAQGHATDAVVLTAASSLTVADATHAHSAETPTLDASTATPLTVADATQAQSSDAATLATASSISVADATQGQSADAADLTTAHSLSVADATQAQSAEVPTLDTGNATPLSIADSTHGHTADNLALLAACLLSVADATQAQQTDSVDLVTLHHLAAADATHAMSSESPTLTIPGTGTGATVEEIVAALQAAVLPVNVAQVNAIPLAGVGSDGDPWRAA